MTEKVKKWHGNTVCGFCTRNATQYNYFIDGKTIFGSWALMCLECFEKYGVGLGRGLGQKYDAKTLEKVEG